MYLKKWQLISTHDVIYPSNLVVNHGILYPKMDSAIFLLSPFNSELNTKRACTIVIIHIKTIWLKQVVIIR